MFLLSIRRPMLRYSHPSRRERQTMVCTLTHLPTGRRWVFNSRRAALAAQSAMAAAVAAGQLTILPVVADEEAVAAAA